MKKDIIDDTVKPGVERVDHSNPLSKNKLADNPIADTENEKDPDDLVHELSMDTPTAENEQDLDELVHQIPTKTIRDNDEKDPDDLVHGK